MSQFAYSSPQTSAIAANLASIIGTPGQRQRARILGDQAGLLQAQIDQSKQRSLTEIAQQGKLGAETAGLNQQQGLIGQAVDLFGKSHPNLPLYMGPALGVTLPNSNVSQVGDLSRTAAGLNLGASGKDADVFNGLTLMDGMSSVNGVPVSNYNDRDQVMGTQQGFKLAEIVGQGVADRKVAEAKAAAEGNQDRLTKREFPEPITLTQAQGEAFNNLTPTEKAKAVGPTPERPVSVSSGAVLTDANGNIVFDNREGAEKMSLSDIDKLDQLAMIGLGDVEGAFGIRRNDGGEIKGDLMFTPQVEALAKQEITSLLQEGVNLTDAVNQVVEQLEGQTQKGKDFPFYTQRIRLSEVEKSPSASELEDGKVYTSPSGKIGMWNAKQGRFIEVH